jgi:hypothetical protein
MRLRRTSAIATIALLTGDLAWAYRPYDSTDADVAEIELELGWQEADFDAQSADGIRAVFSRGIGEDREIVIEGGWLRMRSSGDNRASFEGAGAFVKQVHRRGSLQGASGWSLASECGALIPTRGEDAGAGGECSLVASHYVSVLAIHLNAGLAYETDHRWSRFAGLIIEAAGRRRFKPGIEVTHEQSEGSSEFSALAAMSWSVTNACAFDIAHRWRLQPSSDSREWRMGLTWTH